MAALMIQGCGSDVGKSVLVAGLCRLFANRGLKVSPFKAQNMSNNAAVTADGGEIGRAQALQALACRITATTDMNPVLLKPQSDVGAQLIVRGRIQGSLEARGYEGRKSALLDVVVQSYRRLEAQSDLVLIEGAGSPAEINLRAGDIANMGFARAVGAPVALIGDIDRGHVIAALVGAHAVLEDGDRALIKGFIINKFRGDPSLFQNGRTEIARRTGWRDLGMVPWLPAARSLPAEDAVVLDHCALGAAGRIKIAVPLLSRIANFDDFDPLRAEPNVNLVFIGPGQPLPGDADLVILPGTKASLADLAFLRAQGWDVDLMAHLRRGGRLIGICGGFQMLGRRISDPEGVEGRPGEAAGLALLDIETVLTGDKVLRRVNGRLANLTTRFEGYEMHVGRSTGPALAHPWLLPQDGTSESALSANGKVAGCYVHALFALGETRAALMAQWGAASAGADDAIRVDAALDQLALALETALDIPALVAIAGSSG
jgi:adenosylcobyric acid synthase